MKGCRGYSTIRRPLQPRALRRQGRPLPCQGTAMRRGCRGWVTRSPIADASNQTRGSHTGPLAEHRSCRRRSPSGRRRRACEASGGEGATLLRRRLARIQFQPVRGEGLHGSTFEGDAALSAPEADDREPQSASLATNDGSPRCTQGRRIPLFMGDFGVDSSLSIARVARVLPDRRLTSDLDILYLFPV